MNFLTKIAIGITIILAIYAFIPMVWIDIIGKFALGWMVMDIVDHFFGD